MDGDQWKQTLEKLLGKGRNQDWPEFIYTNYRQEARLLAQIITGLGNLRYYLHKVRSLAEGAVDGAERKAKWLYTF